MNTALPAGDQHTVRLSCRVNPRIKQRAEEAAALLGQSITDFTEAALREKAEQVLEQVHKIQLSERDFEHFIKVINTSTAPTDKLAAAMQQYERLRADEPGGNW